MMTSLHLLQRSLALLLCLVSCVTAALGKDFPNNCDERVNQIFTEYVTRPESVGISIGLSLDGETRFYGAGAVAKTTNQSPDENTVFEIGSISKTLTGVLLAEAVEAGLIELDDDIRIYLEGEYPNLEYEGEPIRVKHLLNHTSGLPFQLPHKLEDFESMTSQKALKLREIQEAYSPDDLLRDLHNVVLQRKPGVNLSYSNTAAQLLAIILEKVRGEGFAELLAAFTHSVEMDRTGVDPVADARNVATGYNDKGEEMPPTPKNMGPAGSIRSTAFDLIKYGQLHLEADDYRVRLCHEPTWGSVEYYAVGLNWQMERRAEKPYRIWQSGCTGGFTSLLQVYPDDGLAVSILTNESSENSQETLSRMAEDLYEICNDGSVP